jgi:amino acid transporter
LIGWALIVEYTIGGSAVARGISPNLVSGIAPASGLFFMGHIEQELNFLNSLYKLNEK